MKSFFRPIERKIILVAMVSIYKCSFVVTEAGQIKLECLSHAIFKAILILASNAIEENQTWQHPSLLRLVPSSLCIKYS